MKEVLDDFANGRFDINRPKLCVDTSQIQLNIPENQQIEGTIHLNTGDNFKITGYLYCDHPDIRFEKNSFEGNDIILNYIVSSTKRHEKDVIDGNIRIFTNLGIKDIPVSITIIAPSITIGNVTISDLDEFAILLNENYLNATRFFMDEKFESVVLKNNEHAIAIYRQICLSGYKEDAADRFAYFLGLKDKSVIGFVDIPVHRMFAPTDFSEYTILINRENSSHIDIEVSCFENFIELKNNVIKNSEFVAGKFSFKYYVKPDKLSDGLNEALIYFKNDLQTIIYRVLVDNSKIGELEKKKLAKKRHIIYTLMNKYIDFRLNKISKEVWGKESLDYLISLERLSDDLFIKLYKVHLLLAINDEEQARLLLYSIHIEEETDITTKAYFLYLVAFFKNENDFATSLTEDLKKYRRQRGDLFSLLWFLLFLDDDYVNNASNRYKALKEQYEKSGDNVLLLCEGAVLLNKNPHLLNEFTDFEIQVCHFALKRDYISGTLWNAIFHITGFLKVFKKSIYRLLLFGYDKYMTFEKLNILCKYCITGACIDSQFLNIYEQGIKQGLNLNGIYEYYLRSLLLCADKPILKQALHYYKYNTNLSDDERAVLYANILRFYHDDDIYKDYEEVIKEFTMAMLSKKCINNNLVYLYNNLITSSDITSLNVESFAFMSLLKLVKITYKNAKNIVLIDSRLKEPSIIKLCDNMAVVPICSKNVSIGFMDEKNLIHLDKEYINITPLIERDDLLKLCDKYNPMIFEYLLYKNDFIKLALSNKISSSYKLKCNAKAAKYYSQNPYDANAVDFLENVDEEFLNAESISYVAGLMALYNRVNAAVRLMHKYGYYDVKIENSTMLCEAIIKIDDMDILSKLYDDSWFVSLCAFLYKKGVRSAKIVQFLSKCFKGSLPEMIQLWESCGFINIERSYLEEQILFLSCYLRCVDENVLKVYENYTLGKIDKKLTLCYLSLLAFDYYVLKNKPKHKKKIFFHIVNYYMNFKQLSGICHLATLDYLAGIKEISDDDKKFILEIIKYYMDKGIYFDIFEAFIKILEENNISLYGAKRQKYFVTHIDESGKIIFIKYRLLNKKGEPIVRGADFKRNNMQEIFPCIYVMDFILFAGESVNYIVSSFENEVEIEIYEKTIIAQKRKYFNIQKDRYFMTEEMLSYTSKKDIDNALNNISILDRINKELFLIR